MQAIITTIVRMVGWVGDLAVAVFKAIWDLLTDAVCWVFDQLFQVVVSMVSAIDVSAFSGAVGSWSSLPSEILNMLGLIGFGYCMGIIAAAIMIRLTLQLIPFVRLGS